MRGMASSYARPEYHILTGMLLVPNQPGLHPELHLELHLELQVDRDLSRHLNLDPEDQVEPAQLPI